MDPEVTIVVESYTHIEGGDSERLRKVLREATTMVNGRGEVLVTDASADGHVARLLANDFPSLRFVEAAGLGYDTAKMKAAAVARGEYVVYLDGDCVPESGWLGAHLAALRSRAQATGGFTRYEGGFMAALCTVMDFGFLLPRAARVLGCYASNNSGFRRELLATVPVPTGPMRCHCFAHAQLLLRRGTPVQMVPQAAVEHEQQPFFRERYRQGFDAVAATWVDPELFERKLLRIGPLAVPLVYARNVAYDWIRLVRGRRDLGLSPLQAIVGLAVFPVLRLVDATGMLRATLSRRRCATVSNPVSA